MLCSVVVLVTVEVMEVVVSSLPAVVRGLTVGAEVRGSAAGGGG